MSKSFLYLLKTWKHTWFSTARVIWYERRFHIIIAPQACILLITYFNENRLFLCTTCYYRKFEHPKGVWIMISTNNRTTHQLVLLILQLPTTYLPFCLAWSSLHYPLKEYLLHMLLLCLRQSFPHDLTAKYGKRISNY